MKSFDELVKLEKCSFIDLENSAEISCQTNPMEDICTRIVSYESRFFYHQTKNNKVIQCFEIALDFEPFDDVKLFSYTPDDLHRYRVDSRFPEIPTVLRLEENRINPGMSCSYHGNEFQYMGDGCLLLNGVALPPVVPDVEFGFKLTKNKILAIGGAKGLFAFLDQIAEQAKHDPHPLFCTCLEALVKRYS